MDTVLLKWQIAPTQLQKPIMLAAMANITTNLAYYIYNIQIASPRYNTQVSNP